MNEGYEKTFIVDDEAVMLNMFEFSDVQHYTGLASVYIRAAEGFMLVYSITSRSSFEQVQIFQRRIRVMGKEYYPMVLIGNYSTRATEREVSVIEGEKLASEFGCRFVEIDHENSLNVVRAFEVLVRELREHKKAEGVAGLTTPSAEETPHTVKGQRWRQTLAAFTNRWSFKRKT